MVNCTVDRCIQGNYDLVFNLNGSDIHPYDVLFDIITNSCKNESTLYSLPIVGGPGIDGVTVKCMYIMRGPGQTIILAETNETTLSVIQPSTTTPLLTSPTLTPIPQKTEKLEEASNNTWFIVAVCELVFILVETSALIFLCAYLFRKKMYPKSEQR